MQPDFLIPKGKVLGNKTTVEVGNTKLDTLKKPLGFSEVVKVLNAVLEKEYPALTKGLKVERGQGIITALEFQKALNNKFEKNFTKDWDEEMVKRNEKYYDRVAKFNKKRAEDMKMHNPERAQLLPVPVFNALRAFDLSNYPIDNDGRLLFNPDEAATTIGKSTYYAFNKKGELNHLKFPVVLKALKELSVFTGINKDRHINQIPEVKILKAYIRSNGNRNYFNKQLEKISKYKNSLTNPTLMAKRIMSKLTKIDINNDELQKKDFNKYVGAKDYKSMMNLAQVLKKENLVDVAPYPQKLKKYFDQYLNEGKLNDIGKENFAKIMEIYPKKIKKNYNII